MLPAMKTANFQIQIFPIILLLASFVCAEVYIRGKIYNYTYYMIIVNSVPIVVICALAGGKGLYYLSSWNGEFSVYEICYGGFVFYGGFYGAILGIVIFSLRIKKNPLKLIDVMVSVLPLGQAIGRIGCFLNGCCYGKVYNGILRIKYPVEGKMMNVFPTWFLESFFCIVLFLFLQILVKSNRLGVRTSIYMMGYAVFRFFEEYLRGDEYRGFVGNYSISQIISFLTFLFGISVAVYISKVTRNNELLRGKRDDSRYVSSRLQK